MLEQVAVQRATMLTIAEHLAGKGGHHQPLQISVHNGDAESPGLGHLRFVQRKSAGRPRMVLYSRRKRHATC
jgi:hypothetical protein